MPENADFGIKKIKGKALLSRISRPAKHAAGAALIVLATATVVALEREADHSGHDAISGQLNLNRDARIMSDLFQTPESGSDFAELDRIARIFLKDTDIDSIRIFGPTGDVWVSAGVPGAFENDADVQRLIHASTGSFSRDGRIYLALPMDQGGEQQGTILVRTTFSYGVAHIKSGMWKSALLALFCALFAALLVYSLSRRSKSFIDLATAAIKQIKPGSADTVLDDLSEIDPKLSESMMSLVGQYEAAIFTHQRAAVTDPATGLMNRINFMNLIDDKIKIYGDRSVVLGLIDINRFRRLNDQIGVKRADEVLALIGRRLRDQVEIADRSVRPDLYGTAPCQLGRLNGDQFAMLIPMADESLATEMISSVVGGFLKPFEIDGRKIEISVSTAAAIAPRDALSGFDLLKQAEMALERSKFDRMTKPFFYNRSMAEEANSRVRMEDEIRRGVENGEFIAVFQPKVEFESNKVVGAEALARWRRADGSAVSPGRFIPIAEELGLISKIGIAVLRDACMEAARWHGDNQDVRIAVNVSPHQFEDPEFIPAIYEALDESGLSPDRLELEITESVAVEDPDKVARVMRPLRARGVRLAIDDFGTGHSNFTTVTRLPFDVFKIDQQFVRALNEDPHAPAIIEMILAMAEALGQETVAEGVETEEQYKFLKRRDCTIGQGYYFSPPLPGHEFRAFLRHWKATSGSARLTGAA